MPANKIYSFDNHLTSISCNGYCSFNFTLSNGDKTNTGAPENQVVSLNPPGSFVKKVSVWCGTGNTHGIQMFNKEGACLLKIGNENCEKFDIDLDDGERIVGV